MYKFDLFDHWARNETERLVSGDIEFYRHCNPETYIHERFDFYQQTSDGVWHSLYVYADIITVSLDFLDSDYDIDTTMFSNPMTEEEYFQYLTVHEHKYLTESEFRIVINLSKYLEDSNADN